MITRRIFSASLVTTVLVPSHGICAVPMPTESGHFRIEAESPAKKLLIVFAYVDQPLEVITHTNFIERGHSKILFLNPGKNDWYQTGISDIADDYYGLGNFLRRLCSEQFPDHEIICLGHSMGAFAAIGFGIELGATRVLASVPEIELQLPGSVSIGRLKNVHIQMGNLAPFLRRNEKTRIIGLVGDQNAFDCTQAHLLSTFSMTEVWHLDCSHITFPYLRDKGRLKPLITAFIDDSDVGQSLEGVANR